MALARLVQVPCAILGQDRHVPVKSREGCYEIHLALRVFQPVGIDPDALIYI
jgi:hypothetical protein